MSFSLVNWQTVKGLCTHCMRRRPQLGCRQQQSQYGQECRRFLSVYRAGAQDGCGMTGFKSPWPMYRSFSMSWSSHGQRNMGQMGCSSDSSVWKKPSSSVNALVGSGEAQTIEQLWEDYFVDPCQWYDNRVDKRNLRSPDFKHKVTKKALWVDGWSTPAWVKVRLKLENQGRWQPDLDHGTRVSQPPVQEKRLLEGHNGRKNNLSPIARESRQLVQGSSGRMHLQSAKTTSEQIAILKNRLQQGIAVNSHMCYVDILKQCLKQKDLVSAKQVHECIFKGGMEQNRYVANHLMSVYIRCGRLQDARQVFDKLVKKNVFSWTIMIGGYAEQNHGDDAMEVFGQMRQEGVQANEVTYVSILKACSNESALKWGKEVHECIRHDFLESGVRVGTALVQMYAKCGCMKEARQAFEVISNRNVICWTVMIGAYAESGCSVEAYELFLQMIREGFNPDAVTYLSILNLVGSSALEWVKKVHSHVLDAGLESDVRVGNALVNVYAKSGSIEDARLVFDRMEERDLVTWNTMIGGLAQHGCGREALEVFRSMIAVGVEPDGYSFVAVLSACSHAGLLDEGRRLFLAMTQDYGLEPSVLVCNCMVDLLGRAGLLEEAKLFIGNMPVEPNEASWGALLGACRTHGNVKMAEVAAQERIKLDPSDAATYVLLSNVYAAVGKWEEVSLVRSMMEERGIRKEPGCTWIEVDNKIHEFIVKDRSHPEAKEIYAELSRLSERIKAEGYIPDTQLVLQNVDEEEKELFLCSHSEKLAIAYGLLRTPPGEAIRVYKNLRVCSDCHTATKFISKVTGREIVARDAMRFHHFKDGVCSCDDYW